MPFFLLGIFSYCLSFSQSDTSSITVTDTKPNKGFIVYANNTRYGESSSMFSVRRSEKRILNLSEPTMFYKADSLHMPFLLLPGENVYITVKHKFYEAEIRNNPVRTNDLKLLREIVLKLGPIYGPYSIENISKSNSKYRMSDIAYLKGIKKHFKAALLHEKERDSMLYNIYLKRIAFVDSFRSKNKISSFFETYIHHYFFYSYLNSLILGLTNDNNKMNVSGELQRMLRISNKDQHNDSLLVIDRYRGFLYNYYQYLYKLALKQADSLNVKINIINNYFTGPAKDYLLFIIAKESISSSDSFESFLEYFYSNCSSMKYIEIIKRQALLFDLSNNDLSMDEMISQSSNKVNLNDILKGLKGKIIYLDFWASWCIPCMEEMPYSLSLQKKYSRNEDIIFIYISMDKDRFAWEKVMKNNSFLMNEKNSFLFLRGFQSVFAKKYNIKLIPRYILIGKDGRIISFDAPRPRDQKLVWLINRYIDK